MVYGASITFVVHEARGHPSACGRLLLAWTTVLFASLVAIALSATVLGLIFTWEITSLALWALISVDTRNKNSVRAGILVVSEAGALAALGAGVAFAALDKPIPAGIALVAGLYHMLNHSAYKTLLFLGAGGIQSATGTDDMDRLGGLMKRLPVFGTLFFLGALAIGALPPFNGFVSEWLTLESLLRIVEVSAVPVRMVFALAGALLALTAGLALTCFIMLAGSTLLGLPRSEAAAAVRRVPPSVTIPMTLLVLVCLALGVLATVVIPILGPLVAPIAGRDPTAALVPAFFHATPALPDKIAASLAPIGTQIGAGVLPLRGLAVLHSGGASTPVIFAMSTALSFVVIAVLLLLVWGLSRALGRRRVRRARAWDAGLTRLRPEMTYNATGFAAPVRTVFTTLLHPAVTENVERHGVFATGIVRETQIVHVVDRLVLHPLISGMQTTAALLARMQHGRVNAYAGYVLLALVAVLVAASVILR